MTYTLRFLPEVEDDAIAAYMWYEEKSHGLGEDFLRMFYAFTTEQRRTRSLFLVYFIVLVTLKLSEVNCETVTNPSTYLHKLESFL